MLNTVSRLIRVGLVCSAVIVAAGVTQPAMAQRARMMGGGMEVGTNPITQRSLDAYAKLLGMDEAQKEAASDLLKGYREQHTKAKEAMEAKVQAGQETMRDTGDWQAGAKEMREAGFKYRGEVETLEKTFVTDLQTLLTTEQMGKWDGVERHRRREKHMRVHFYSGAAVDILNVADRQGIAMDTPELKELRSQYEMDLDRRLLDWEKRAKEAEDDMRKDESGMNMQAQMDAMNKMGEVSKQIRDMNRDFAGRMMATMAPEQKAKFEKAFNERAYPRIYKRVHTQEQLEAAGAFTDLDAGQKESLKSLREQWERDSAPLNKAWVDETIKTEDEGGGTMGVMMRQFSSEGGDKGNDLKKIRQDRKELEERVGTRLKELLNPTQRERLPSKKPSDRNPWEEMFGGADDDEE
jgi:hypothetical protein